MGLTGFVSRHRKGVVIAAAAGALLLVAGIVWFEPHKLFIDDQVDEPVPGGGVEAAAAPEPEESEEPVSPAQQEADSDEAQETPGGPATLSSGSFRSLEHSTSGRAKLLELPDGRVFLRFEELETSNGPDLRVYLSEIPAGDDWYVYGERYVDLGALKGNIGDQNYEVPGDVDLDRYVSAVIWCRRFAVGFGVAPLD